MARQYELNPVNGYPNAKDTQYGSVQNSADPFNNMSNLNEMESRREETKWAIVKSTRVRPTALIRILEEYAKEYRSTSLKAEIFGVIDIIRSAITIPDGETLVFVCRGENAVKSNVEFLCCAVCLYESGDDVLSDFCISAHSYAKSIRKYILVGCLAALSVGAVCAIVIQRRDAVGISVAAVIIGVASLLSFIVFKLDARKASSTMVGEEQANAKAYLKVKFIHELVSRGYAIMRDGRLVITKD